MNLWPFWDLLFHHRSHHYERKRYNNYYGNTIA